MRRRTFIRDTSWILACGLWLPRINGATPVKIGDLDDGMKTGRRPAAPSGGGGDGSFSYTATKVYGTGKHMGRATNLGMSDGANGLVSFWYKNTIFVGQTSCILTNNNGYIYFGIDAGKVLFLGYDWLHNLKLYITHNTAITDTNWHHYAASWDLAGHGWLYVDGSDDTNVITNSGIDINYGYLITAYEMFSNVENNPCYGSFSEFWFGTEYKASSIVSSFRSSGKPKDLGSDGSTPTGNKPVIYLHANAANFGTNSGSGGDFTIASAFEDDPSIP
jgi:hypothetical protein